jgi:hypothetical protein
MKTPVCALMCAALTTGALADELWRQDAIGIFGGLSSQDARNPGGLGWFSEVVDNFTAQPNWNVTNVEFWGGYASTTPGNTLGFMIRFYEDNAGQVGPLVATQDVAAFTRTPYYTHPSLGFIGYHYTLTLNSPVSFPNGGSHWFAVVAILDRGGGSVEPQWGWSQATTLTAPDCKQRFFSPTFNPQGQDVSFVLHGNIGGASCYPNCDNSTTAPVLNVQDFSCFLNAFANGESYANCDNSTTAPVLNVQDFSCFLNAFAAGCS